MTEPSSYTGQNILCIDQFCNLGGGQHSLLDLLPAFSGQGWRPCVALPGDGPFPESIRRLGYHTHRFASGSYRARKKTFRQHLRYALEMASLVHSLTELVKVEKIDLLYVNGPRYIPPAAWVGWRTGTPVVFHCHNRLLQGSAIALAGQALELASAHVIACCHYVAEPLTEYVVPERLRVIYNGVEDMTTGRTRANSKTIKTIGVVGRIEEEKGQLQFVQAARSVLRSAPECEFHVIGSPLFSGLNYKNKVVASSAGLPIYFLDWQDTVAGIYSDLDLLVVPSSSAEATTRVILEAYSAGVPVVALPAGGIPEILKDGETGFLSESSSVEALAQRILSVLRMHPETVRTVVSQARAEWSKHFSLKAYRANVCGFVRHAMRSRGFGYTDCSSREEALTE